MCDSKCGSGGCSGHGCSIALIAKILLIVGGINWGLIGLGMLLGNEESWNVVKMVLGSVPLLEGIVYLLVGIAAVMKIFGCRCGKCRTGCATCSTGNMEHKA